MRFLALLIVLGLAAATAAQEPVPDPTPPHLYYPLAVGNVWEYANLGLTPSGDGWYTRREVTRDTVVNGRRYFVESWTRVDLDWNGWVRPSEQIVRYDSASTQVMVLSGSGVEWPLTCRFGADFGTPVLCGAEPTGDSSYDVTEVQGGVGHTIPLGRGGGVYGSADPDSLKVMAVKTFRFPLSIADYSYHPYYAAPIGYVGDTAEGCACWRNLSYARVYLDDGVYEVGEQFPVAADKRPEAGALTVSASPNPSTGPLVIVVETRRAADVTLEAFDALGRRIWGESLRLGAEAGRVEVDASGWAPGLYVVRAMSGEEAVTATVIRR